MPLLIVMILVALGAQVIAGIYAMLTPFADDLRNIQNYNIAYYGAIAGVERSYLVLRGHTAGFEGSGGWIDANDYGPLSDYKASTIDKEYFGFLARKSNGDGIFWQITNLNSGAVVPQQGKGDLDPDISSGNDYLRLTFDDSIQVPLYVDESSSNDYYTGYNLSNIKNLKATMALKVSLRAPLKLAKTFGVTNRFLDKDASIDLDDDGVIDDIIVNRSLFGYTGNKEFTIFSSINIKSDNSVDLTDTAIRENVINGYFNTTDNIIFHTNSADTNPNEVGGHTQNVDEFNQSPDGAVQTGFNIVLNTKVSSNAEDTSTNPINRMYLKLSLVNLLKYTDNKIYPYLEVKILGENLNKEGNEYNFLPDSYFHITGRGKAGSYDVKIKLKKRVFNVSAASDFTVLF